MNMKRMRGMGLLALTLVVSSWVGCKKPLTGSEGGGGNASSAESVEIGDRWMPLIIRRMGDTLWIAAQDTSIYAYQSRIFAWVGGQVVDTLEAPFGVVKTAYSGGDIWAGEEILVFGENQQQRGVWKYTRGSGWHLAVNGVDMCRIDDPLQIACDRANVLDGSYTLVYTLDGGGRWDSLFLGQYEWRVGMAFDAFTMGSGKFLVMVGIPTYVLMVDVNRSQIDTLWRTPDTLWIVDATMMPGGTFVFVLGPVPDPAVTPIWLAMTTADTFQTVDTVVELTDTRWGNLPKVVLYPHAGKVYGLGKTLNEEDITVFVLDPASRGWSQESWTIPEGASSRGIVEGVEALPDGRWAVLLADPIQRKASVLLLQP